MASIDKTHWPRDVVLASLSGIAATLVMAGLIVLGSRRLSHFDAALVGYTFATLFATPCHGRLSRRVAHRLQES